MARREDRAWEGGKCSGTMYCGDHDHYDFLNEAFGLFAHVNVLQRDMCPSTTPLRGRDHRHDARHAARRRRHAHDPTHAPAASVTSGGTGSILHAMLAYRELRARRARHRPRPNMIKPETAHPAFDKACHLLRHRAASRRRSTRSRRWSTSTSCATHIDDEHHRARRLGLQLRLRHDRPDRRALGRSPSSAASACTSTAASAGSSCRGARSSATTSRRSTSACPGVTTHLGRHPQVRLRPQGHVGAAVPRQGAAPATSTSSSPTGRAASTVAGHRRLPLGRPASPRRGRRW